MAALVVLVAVLAVYVQSLGGPFLWDDRLLILGTPLIEQGGSLGDFLNTPFWSGAGVQGTSTSYYRPLVTLSFALDNAVHGGNAGGFHLTNVVLHATNALLVHALLKKHGTRASTSALVAVAWALLPRLAEAAAWISGRTDLLVALFTLAALLAWGPSLLRRSVAAAFVGLALFAKESALGAVVALAAFVWVEGAAQPRGKRIVQALVALAPTMLVVLGYLALRLFAVGLRSETEDLGTLGRLGTILEASGTYAAMLVDAWRPRAVIGRAGVTSASGIAAGIAFVVLVIALVRFRTRLDARRTLGVALFFGALLPVLHVVPIPLRTLAADRFLYLPTAGLALALAPSIDRFVGVARARWAAALASHGLARGRHVRARRRLFGRDRILGAHVPPGSDHEQRRRDRARRRLLARRALRRRAAAFGASAALRRSAPRHRAVQRGALPDATRAPRRGDAREARGASG
jgi:hypothetical protein